MELSFEEAIRVKERERFQTISKDNGQSFANRKFVKFIKLRKKQKHFRVGILSVKKLGNAVIPIS